MNKRYNNMFILSENLEELFYLCGTNPESITVKESKKMVTFFESLLRDNSVIDYLEELNNQTNSAKKALKEKNLDIWNAEQNALNLEKLEKENEELKTQLEKLKKHCAELSEEKQETITPISAPKTEYTSANSEDSLKIIKDLIALRDTLMARLEWAAGSLDENDNAVKIISNQVKEIGKLLNNAGVKILDDCGEFDSSICTIVETIPTSDDALADTVAKIFRPGYEYNGEMLRSKEVILYVKE